MKSPRELGETAIKQYLAHLQLRGAGPEPLKMHVAGLKFLYGVTLDRAKVAERLPWPKVPQKKPDILIPLSGQFTNFAVPYTGSLTLHSSGTKLTNDGGRLKSAAATGAANQAWTARTSVRPRRNACELAVFTDYVLCAYRYSAAACVPSLNTSLTQCQNGIANVNRAYRGSIHDEARVFPSSWVHEDTYAFAGTAQTGGWPVYRCNNGLGGDFLSKSSTCDDNGGFVLYKHTIIGLAGYSYAPGTAGASPVYRCSFFDRDLFSSRQAGCEGHGTGVNIGYAR